MAVASAAPAAEIPGAPGRAPASRRPPSRAKSFLEVMVGPALLIQALIAFGVQPLPPLRGRYGPFCMGDGRHNVAAADLDLADPDQSCVVSGEHTYVRIDVTPRGFRALQQF